MDLFQKYYNLVLLQLARRSRSEKEIRDYLKKKKAEDAVIDRIVERIQKEKFQSDWEFTRWWVASRTRFKSKSNRIISLELRQKGISDEMIKEALLEKTDDYKSEYEKAYLVAEKYTKKVQGLPKNEQYQRMAAFLSRRGFDYDTLRRVIDDILQRGYNT